MIIMAIMLMFTMIVMSIMLKVHYDHHGMAIMLMFTMIIIFGSHQLIAPIVVDLHLFARSSKFEAQIQL